MSAALLLVTRRSYLPPYWPALCSVDGVMGPTYAPSLHGRQDSKLFGTGLPIIPWAMGAEQCWLPAINNINPMKIGEYKILLYESS